MSESDDDDDVGKSTIPAATTELKSQSNDLPSWVEEWEKEELKGPFKVPDEVRRKLPEWNGPVRTPAEIYQSEDYQTSEKEYLHYKKETEAIAACLQIIDKYEKTYIDPYTKP